MANLSLVPEASATRLPTAPSTVERTFEALHSPAVQALVDAYRAHGYVHACINPLDLQPWPAAAPVLDPKRYELSSEDTARYAVEFAGNARSFSIGELVRKLRASYCGALALECEHVRAIEQRNWLYARLEARSEANKTDPKQCAAVLRDLAAAEAYEQFQRSTFPRQKHFSLEGSETLITLLTETIATAGRLGVEDIVLGMPHRGRLNVLLHVLGLSPAQLLSLFTDHPDPALAAWDIKDHLGYATRLRSASGEVGVSLVHNPSHLGSITPVVCGMVRAMQDRKAYALARKVMPVIIHGDATFSAQGVITETLNLSQTRGYSVGGTLHLILNNQIGSTIWDPRDARSTLHCADHARAIDAPILHVNGDDVEAVLAAAELATEYRVRFGCDVVVNHITYRRFGHFGGDDPTMTQPAMQRRIRSHATVVTAYGERLAAQGVVLRDEVQRLKDETTRLLHEAHDQVCARKPIIAPPAAAPISRPATTAVPADQLRSLLKRLTRVPVDHVLHPGVQTTVERWRALADQVAQPVDFCLAENLAYATLLANGFNVRLTGLDIGRGSFFHRHHVWHDQSAQADGQNAYVPLRHVAQGQGSFSIFESPLSEEAVLGFEYGYSLHCGRDVVVWEAQFGDFVNNAQVIIDQFIASGEKKWGYASGLTILLPHGYDGGGPEHSCAYLGRFLQLCAEDNLRVAMPTTAAQLFHLLRRQALTDDRKPLIVMTPKFWLHGHAGAYSSLSDLAEGGFATLIGDTTVAANNVTRAVVTSGKAYYALLACRAQTQAQVPLLRVEQLYPFPTEALGAELERYPNLRDVVWTQEETRNHGSWYLVRDSLDRALPPGATLRYAGRPASAPTAVCNALQHRAEEEAFVARALGLAAD